MWATTGGLGCSEDVPLTSVGEWTACVVCWIFARIADLGLAFFPRSAHFKWTTPRPRLQYERRPRR